MNASYDVAGKTVLITGAARGIGAALAERLHTRGANLALVGLEPDILAKRARSLGVRAAWFEADVTHAEQLEAAVNGTVERFGSIDVTVANAGLSFIGALPTQPAEQWVRTVEVNLLGVYRTNRAVLPHLVRSQGYLLNIASLAAAMHGALMSAYATSKAGVEAMTDSLRYEVANSGVTVGCAYFGYVDTDLVEHAFKHPAIKKLMSLQPALLATPVPIEQAVAALERGIRRRAHRLWAPWWVGPVLSARGALQPMFEYASRAKQAQIAEAVHLANPLYAPGTMGADPRLGVAVPVREGEEPESQVPPGAPAI